MQNVAILCCWHVHLNLSQQQLLGLFTTQLSVSSLPANYVNYCHARQKEKYEDDTKTGLNLDHMF